MANIDNKKIGLAGKDHIDEESLILYLDGELDLKEAVWVEKHLKDCWSCRAHIGKIESAITNFVDYRESVIFPLIELPDDVSRSFDMKLQNLVEECGHRSLRSFFISILTGLQRVIIVRAAVAAATVVVFIGLFIWWNIGNAVSADQLLDRAITANENRLQTVAHPIAYHRIQIKRLNQSSKSAVADWYIWHDSKNVRFKQASNEGGGGLVQELSEVMRLNNMDTKRPLNASSHSEWRKNVSIKSESIDLSTVENQDVYELRTTPDNIEIGSIIEASIVIRKSDHQPIKQRFRVKTKSGDNSYELTERDFAVLDFTKLNPGFFDNIPSARNDIQALDMNQSNFARSPDVVPIVEMAAASAELEMEVIRLLSTTGADLGREVSVTRNVFGKLTIAGIVDSNNRKKEILGILSSVKDNPVIEIQIETSEEADIRLNSARSSTSNQDRSIIIESTSTYNTIAINQELRRGLNASGVRESNLDVEVNRIADQVLRNSRQALLHAWALRDLTKRFNPEMLRSMDPQSRSKWITLVATHSRNYEREAKELNRQIEFTLGYQMGADSEIPEISSDASIHQAVEQLVDYSLIVDKAVRAAFSISNDSDDSLLKLSAFRKAAASGQRLAARLQGIK